MSNDPAGGVYTGLLLPRRVLRFASRLGFVLVAAILFLVAAYRLTQLWLVPEVSIGISESEPGYRTLFLDLARVAGEKNLKIRVRDFPDAARVAEALEKNQIDFAVIRPVDVLPRNGLTAAILREDPIVIVNFMGSNAEAKAERKAPRKSRGETSDDRREANEPQDNKQDLAGKRVGLVASSVVDRAALTRLFTFHQTYETTLVPVGESPEDIRSAVSGNQLDAIAMIGQPNTLRRLLAALADLQPAIRPVTVSDDMPVFGKATIAGRSLGNGLPREDTPTASVSWRLVAGNEVERATVSALLHALFSQRLALARSSELAWPIKGLGDEGATFAKLPDHRGALDYYNREQQTFMDLYGDWLWLGLFAAGGISSVFAWLVQALSRRRKQLVESILDRLLEILSEARDAKTIEKLNELTVEVDGLVTHAVRQARWRASDPISTTALTLAIDSSRAAIADQRAFFLSRERGESGQARKTASRRAFT